MIGREVEHKYLQVPIGSDSESVTGAAEVLRHRGDEREAALPSRHRPPLRRVVCSVLQSNDVREGLSNPVMCEASILFQKFELVLQSKVNVVPVEHFGVRDELLVVPAVVVEGHVLDKTYLHLEPLFKKNFQQNDSRMNFPTTPKGESERVQRVLWCTLRTFLFRHRSRLSSHSL